MLKRLLLLLIVPFIFSGCQKTQDFYEFDLTVVDQNGNAVANSDVKAFLRPAGSSGLGVYEARETGVTDASGKINIKIDKESAFGFRFDISGTGHFGVSHEILADAVPVTSAYTGELVMHSQSWLRLNILNTSGAIAVFWNFEVEAPECDTCCKHVNTTHVLQGVDIDTTFLCTLYGGQTFTLDGSYTDTEIVEHPFDHSLFAPAGDTLVYDLLY